MKLAGFPLAFALTLSGCAATPPHDAHPAAGRIEVGQAMPDLPLRELASGQPLSLRALKGQVVLLDIWASWCGPCREELPLLDEIATRLAPRGVRIVAVSIDEDPAAAQDFLRLQPHWKLAVAHDPGRSVPAALAPPKMPSSYVVDRDGVLRVVHVGFERADAAKLEAELGSY
jgi:cytochrome c biogenesis protein CcmG/thiol:disulfide interchange protein DsbE